MSIIIDLAVIAIILLCLYGGYKKGLVGMAFSIISFVAAIVIAFVLFNPISTYVIKNTQFDDNIKQAIMQNFNNEEQENKEEQKKEDFINVYISEQVNEVKGNTLEIVSSKISELCIKGIVFIALFILAKFALMFVKAIANLIAELPILKQFNKLGGIAFGGLKGIIIVYIVLAIILLISPMIANTEFINVINNSYIAKIMYNNNLIIKILF